MNQLLGLITDFFQPSNGKHIEHKYREENKTLKSVLNSLSEGVIVADETGKFLYFNVSAQEILGIGSVDVKIEDWDSVYGCFYPDTTTQFPSDKLPLAKAIQNQHVLDEIIFIRNSERPQGVYINVSASPLRDNKGHVKGGTVIFRDVTEKKFNERELKKLSSAVEQTADSVVITDRRGIIEYINPAFEKTTGYSEDEALGQTMSILKSGKHDGAFYKKLWSTILNGNSYEGIIINKKKNGDLYSSEQTITPMKDESGRIKHFVSVLKDITQLLKQQEQDVQIRIARNIQQQLFESHVALPHFDFLGSTIPAAETNGDYYDVIPMSEEVYGLVIGDVSGHGIGAAMIMTQTRAFLHAFSKHETDPGVLLTWLNQELVRDLGETHFVTLVLIRIDLKKKRMDYASAGHIPGYLLDASGKIKQVLESTGIPLGFIADYQYEKGSCFELDPEDLIVLLTDGIVEAHDSDENEFGSDRALELIRSNKDAPIPQLIETLHQAVLDFSSDLEQEDDITSIICRYKPDSQSKKSK
ncbi:SpoIIE family protein phosphatase [bacterium]